MPSEIETRKFKIIGSKSTLNLLDRRFIENRVNRYTKYFAWDKWLSTVGFKINICRKVSEKQPENIKDNGSCIINYKINTESGNKCHLLVLQAEQGSHLVKCLKQTLQSFYPKQHN